MAAQIGGEEGCLLARALPGSVAAERVILHTGKEWKWRLG